MSDVKLKKAVKPVEAKSEPNKGEENLRNNQRERNV